MSVCDSNDSRMSVSEVMTVPKRKKGIIYISSIPKYMNVTKLRELLSEYGDIGKVFLQPASNRNIHDYT